MPNLVFLKFIYYEKATNFCKISTVDLSYVVMVRSTVEISQIFVAFSEYMNFTILTYLIILISKLIILDTNHKKNDQEQVRF